MFDVSSHPLCITLCVTERNQLVIKLACTLFYMSGYYCREWVIIWGHFLSLFRKDTFSTGICCCSLLDGIRTGPISCLIANNWRWFWFHHMVDTFVKSAQAHSRKIKSELSFIFFSLFSWFKSSAIAVLCQVVPKLPYSPYNTIPYHILSWEVCWSLKQTTTVKYAAKTKCYCFKLYSFEIINIHDNVK